MVSSEKCFEHEIDDLIWRGKEIAQTQRTFLPEIVCFNNKFSVWFGKIYLTKAHFSSFDCWLKGPPQIRRCQLVKNILRNENCYLPIFNNRELSDSHFSCFLVYDKRFLFDEIFCSINNWTATKCIHKKVIYDLSHSPYVPLVAITKIRKITFFAKIEFIVLAVRHTFTKRLN